MSSYKIQLQFSTLAKDTENEVNFIAEKSKIFRHKFDQEIINYSEN